MARQKSPHGRLRQILLRYREEDPRFACIKKLLEDIPAGEKNAHMLDALIAGLRAARGEHTLAPAIRQIPDSPASPDSPPKEYGQGAVSVFTQF